MGSAVAWGPAASSAMVIAAIASCSGSVCGSIRSSPITTDVSTRPTAPPLSGTRRWVLAGDQVQVRSKARSINRRGAAERFDGCVARDEPLSPDRGQFADGDTTSCHNEALAGIERPHDLTAVVAYLSLCEFLGHTNSVAHVLHTVRAVAAYRPPQRAIITAPASTSRTAPLDPDTGSHEAADLSCPRQQQCGSRPTRGRHPLLAKAAHAAPRSIPRGRSRCSWRSESIPASGPAHSVLGRSGVSARGRRPPGMDGPWNRPASRGWPVERRAVAASRYP